MAKYPGGILAIVCLVLGLALTCRAEMGIPFGLFWGANLEDVSQVCARPDWKCHQELFTNARQKLEVVAEFSRDGRDYKASFVLEDNRLASISLLRYISGEDASQGIQDCARDFGSFNGFVSPDDYEVLSEENNNGSSMVNYLTAASRITVFYGPVAPGSTLMAFYWNPLAEPAPGQQNELNDIEKSLDELKR